LERCDRSQRSGGFSVTAPFTEITEATITMLMNRFYGVRRELALGAIFVDAVAEYAWAAHLENMYAFWSSVMLTSSGCKGNLVSTHRIVAGVTRPLFGDWLDLFEATAAECFVLTIADRFAHAERRIADSLKLARFFRADQSWPEDLRRRPASYRA
jgi:hemoglobin